MHRTIKYLTIFALLAAVVIVAAPAQASTGDVACTVSPSDGAVGDTFVITCTGFSPNSAALNVYAVEPDGRASGLNIYGFFPTGVKTDATGTTSFAFVTEVPGRFSAPAGDYIFVVQELKPGGGIARLAQVPVHVGNGGHPLLGGTLTATPATPASPGQQTFDFAGSGFDAFQMLNVWVTQPPAQTCSGLGIDQLTLDALAGNGSSLWSGPGTVKADMDGNIAFSISFRESACRGVHMVSVQGPQGGTGASVGVEVAGQAVTETGAMVWVNPASVPAFHSLHTVNGSGFPSNAGVSCWYTRPDGRVLFFINVNAKTDAAGNFSVASTLDDFPPYTSTDPGQWAVTCATPDHSSLGIGYFDVFGLTVDP